MQWEDRSSENEVCRDRDYVERTLVIQSTQNESKAKRVRDMSEKACAISIKTRIILEPIITVKKKS